MSRCYMCLEDGKTSNPCQKCWDAARCQACGGQDGDHGQFMLCEGMFCGNGGHVQCYPELKGKVPEGPWYCNECQITHNDKEEK